MHPTSARRAVRTRARYHVTRAASLFTALLRFSIVPEPGKFLTQAREYSTAPIRMLLAVCQSIPQSQRLRAPLRRSIARKRPSPLQDQHLRLLMLKHNGEWEE